MVAGVGILLSGCSPASGKPARSPASGDVIATVGARPVTLDEVDRKALQAPATSFGAVKLSQALYEARRTALEELVDDLLIDQDAAARSLDRAALVAQEVTSKVPPVNDADVGTWYAQNKGRLQGATLDQGREAIRTYLAQQRTAGVRRQYLDRLRSRTSVRVMLDPPRQIVAAAGRPSKGPANAPIELIEFSDFQCPYCLQSFPTVTRLLSAYGDRIHFVYRHYPLPNHPNARPAAEAAQCAAEQGKFWPYHDQLFGNPSRLADADLKQHASQLGLDRAQFDACVDSRKHRAAVEADIQAGGEAGVNGTPAFFINGRLLSGAQPFEAFKQVIDEELALKKG